MACCGKCETLGGCGKLNGYDPSLYNGQGGGRRILSGYNPALYEGQGGGRMIMGQTQPANTEQAGADNMYSSAASGKTGGIFGGLISGLFGIGRRVGTYAGASCENGCDLKHLFNNAKRNACIQECRNKAQQYNQFSMPGKKANIAGTVLGLGLLIGIPVTIYYLNKQ